jgi:hypothetical protein
MDRWNPGGGPEGKNCMTMHLRHIARSALVASTAFSLGACASHSPADTGPRPSNGYTLEINNGSDLEVVIYALPTVGAPGLRLTSARSFGKTFVTIPKSLLSASNDVLLRLHPIGYSNSADWFTPRLSMSGDMVAKLHILSTARGDLSLSSFYGEVGNAAIPLSMKRGH